MSRDSEIKMALKELEEARREDFPPSFINAVVKELDRLKWSTEKCVRKINDCKYRTIPYVIRLSDITEGEPIVNYWLIERRAEEILKEKGIVPLKKYQELEKLIEEGSRMDPVAMETESNNLDVSLLLESVVIKVRDIMNKAIFSTMYNLARDKDKAISAAKATLKNSQAEVDFYLKQLKKDFGI